MAISDGFKRGFTQLENYAGETVTLRSQVVAHSTDNATNDDPTHTNTDTSVTAIVQIMTLDDIQVQTGELAVGDAIIFFDSSITVANGYYVQHNSIWYEVTNVIPENPEGTLVFTEAHAKRYEYRYSDE